MALGAGGGRVQVIRLTDGARSAVLDNRRKVGRSNWAVAAGRTAVKSAKRRELSEN